MAIELLLLGCKGQVDKGPGDDPRVYTEEELEVFCIIYIRFHICMMWYMIFIFLCLTDFKNLYNNLFLCKAQENLLNSL